MIRNGLPSVMEADRGLIEVELRRALSFGSAVPTRLAQAMRYAVLGPGKRLRPILALEAFRAAGGRNPHTVLPFCCGIELIHTFSLVHDDLPSMDDDDFRRGRPSLHRKYGEATAILAADALFAYAFELIAAAPGDGRRKLDAMVAICRAVGPAGMAGGQVLDLKARTHSGVRELAALHRKKTAEFMSAALTAGAIVGGAGKPEQEKLRDAGLALGMLFQTTDDLLDEEQESDRDRTTMAALCGGARTRRRAERQARLSRRAFDRLGPRYRMLAALPELILNRCS